MSTEQFSEKPLSAPKKKVCPACGEVAPSAAAVACWLCGEKFALEEMTPTPDGRSNVLIHEGKSWPDWASWAIFGAIAIAVAVGLADRAPGVLCLLFVLAIPVVIGVLVSRSSVESGHSGPRSVLNGLFVAFGVIGVTVGVIGIIAMIAIASFFAALASICSGPGR